MDISLMFKFFTENKTSAAKTFYSTTRAETTNVSDYERG